jgi:hypothetical protein
MDAADEDARRSKLYNSLVYAQRRYAEKLSSPSLNRFTKEEWDALGEGFTPKDWAGAFSVEDTPQRGNRLVKKENISTWKGKEKSAEVDSDEEDAATLRLVF